MTGANAWQDDRLLLPLVELAREAKGLDQATFLGRYKDAALILSVTVPAEELDATVGRVETPNEGTPTTTVVASHSRFLSAPLPALTSLVGGSGEDDGTYVFFLRKSERNPFSTMITLGRARNNDIIVELPMISKLHTYFTHRPEGHRVYDQGSTNGTIVDGRRLSRGEFSLLQDGARIELAVGVVLHYYTPGGLFGVLALRTGMGAERK